MLNPKDVFKFQIESGSERTSIDKARIFKTRWLLEANNPYLDGHFPGMPLLPAVATLDGTIEFLRQALGLASLVPKSVINAKFMAPIEPGIEIEISISELGAGKWQAEWFGTSGSNSSDISQDSAPLEARRLLARVAFQV